MAAGDAEGPAPKPTSAFVGFMGGGKTRARKGAAAGRGGQAVGAGTGGERALGAPPGGRLARDGTGEVERELGAPAAEVFARDGEARFREVEERLALEALAAGGLVALGGGAVESARVQQALESCFTVWCRITEEAAWDRCADDPDRP